MPQLTQRWTSIAPRPPISPPGIGAPTRWPLVRQIVGERLASLVTCCCGSLGCDQLRPAAAATLMPAASLASARRRGVEADLRLSEGLLRALRLYQARLAWAGSFRHAGHAGHAGSPVTIPDIGDCGFLYSKGCRGRGVFWPGRSWCPCVKRAIVAPGSLVQIWGWRILRGNSETWRERVGEARREAGSTEMQRACATHGSKPHV